MIIITIDSRAPGWVQVDVSWFGWTPLLGSEIFQEFSWQRCVCLQIENIEVIFNFLSWITVETFLQFSNIFFPILVLWLSFSEFCFYLSPLLALSLSLMSKLTNIRTMLIAQIRQTFYCLFHRTPSVLCSYFNIISNTSSLKVYCTSLTWFLAMS